MSVRKWLLCLHCERAFEVTLSSEPGEAQGPIELAPELEAQLGVERDGETYVECPYEDCDGSPLDFWWWDTEGRGVPEVAKQYSLYPDEASEGA